MRILVCNKFYRPYGGPETVLAETSKLLEADGHEVIPFSMSHPDNWPSKWSSFFVSQVDYHAQSGLLSQIREAGKIIYSFEAKRKMEELIDETKPDLVHAHNIYHQLSPSIFGPIRKRGIPVVMSLHDYKLACPNMLFYVGGEVCERCRGGRFYNAVTHKCVSGGTTRSLVCAVEMYVHRLFRLYERSVDVFVAPSRFLIEALTRCGVAGKRMLHIPNMAEVDLYDPRYENDGYIFYFGKLTPEKGVDTLIRAVALVETARLVLAGTGSGAEELRALADQLAPGRVEFTGFLTGDALRRALERSAFVVIPSVWYENCPCTILEAYCAGKPVVGSRIGGIPELIEEGVDGFLFDPGDHQELAEKIELLLSDQASIVAMGQAGRRKMELEYSREAHYRRLMEIYRELVPGFGA